MQISASIFQSTTHMHGLFDRSTGLETGVHIPIDRQSANEMLMVSKFGIFGNLPREEVFQLEGHAYVSLIGILKHLFAHKIPINDIYAWPSN